MTSSIVWHVRLTCVYYTTYSNYLLLTYLSSNLWIGPLCMGSGHSKFEVTATRWSISQADSVACNITPTLFVGWLNKNRWQSATPYTDTHSTVCRRIFAAISRSSSLWCPRVPGSLSWAERYPRVSVTRASVALDNTVSCLPKFGGKLSSGG